MRHIEGYLYVMDSFGGAWPLGRYFSDETDDFQGPFDTIEDARAALAAYMP